MSKAWWKQDCQQPDAATAKAARAHQTRLTKPAGSLGQLEDLAVRLASLQKRDRPAAQRVRIAVFAGDHGIAARGVSVFPQAVTQQMVANFAGGGAAISVLARALGATLEVIDAGTLNAGELPPGVIDARQGSGTADFGHEPAMSLAQVEGALLAGRDAVDRALASDAALDLFIAGDMGIGNTAAATALACALLNAAPVDIAGPGTGLDAAGVSRKAAIILDALTLHAGQLSSPQEALRRVGGFEIAAICGAYLRCAQVGLPVLVDGFITSAAALCAVRMNPGLRHWLLFAHRSAEPGHARILAALDADALLDIGMRLGEASGAAVAVPLLRLACELHAGMATFDSAGVSDRA